MPLPWLLPRLCRADLIGAPAAGIWRCDSHDMWNWMDCEAAVDLVGVLAAALVGAGLTKNESR